MKNKDLPISQLPLATELKGLELLPFAADSANGAMLVSLLAAFIRQGMATLAQVNACQPKLTSGPGIQITPENVIKTTLDVKPFKVVSALPTEDIEEKIYLVPDPDGEEDNLYIEYCWLGDRWEELGKFKAAIDLTPYETTEHAGQTYATKTELAGYVTTGVYETLSATVTQLAGLVAQMKNVLDTIPTIPASDGKIYGLSNGAWVEIASDTEDVATVTKETEEQS